MSCHSNHMLDKIHQVVSSKDMGKVLDGDAVITQVHAMKKGMIGKTVEGMKVKLIRNEVWKQM